MEANCKDCKKRYIGCHSKCESYLAFRKALDEENKKIRQIKQNERIADDDYHTVRSKRRLKV